MQDGTKIRNVSGSILSSVDRIMEITSLKPLLEAYNKQYNCNFSITPRYSLEDDFDSTTWPNCNNPGVYVITDSVDNIIYVGTSEVLGRRFYQWFGNGSSMELRHPWTNKPSALYAIATNKYERLSLEAYLISIINPPENTMLRSK